MSDEHLKASVKDVLDDNLKGGMGMKGGKGAAAEGATLYDAAISAGRKGSVVAARYASADYRRKPGAAEKAKNAPTNEEVAQAVQAKVAAAVETTQKYRHVAWYSFFVTAYLMVLYLQASAYKSGEVVSTLRNTLMSNGELSMTFRNEDDVLAYLGKTVLLPIWKDPVCGDSNCEWPWEFPAYGRFGCRADCGVETSTTKIVMNVRADFVGHPNISPRVLMASAKWNLCLTDEDRLERGEADLCWFEEDKTFDSILVNTLEAMDVIDGKWYVIVKGDYAGRVSGNIYDLSNGTDPESLIQIQTEPAWEKCELPKVSQYASTGSTKLRKLLSDITAAQQRGEEFDGRTLLERTLKEVLNPEVLEATKRQQAMKKEADLVQEALQKVKDLAEIAEEAQAMRAKQGRESFI